ncbi:biliverdin-producing heme oxygenase [Pelagibacterium nitratireducens]|uniref:Biliverdin-producing heme oxygenase n=1 Tax=Pelagibacterium nitratireducens TaxID=1046114 RepID=A0ABZ2I0V3_9HYPH
MIQDRAAGFRFVLRDATGAAHQRLDEAAGRFDLGSRDDYRRFLVWHGAIVPGLETHMAANGIERIVADWAERKRTAALLSDLGALGVSWPGQADLQLQSGRGALFGMAYVLEGSRLGSAMLVRRVDPALRGAATGYLDHGAGLKLWPRFLDILNTAGLSGAEQQAAIDAANQVFMLFERELLAHFEPDGAAPGQ